MAAASYDEARSTWEGCEGFVQPGHAGFNLFAQEMMRKAGVPSNRHVVAPGQLVPAQWVKGEQKPRLQPYQETVAFLCRPESYSNPRMLVVHRTGCGKTATMVQIANNYFLDRRPKLLIFPTAAVCANFYRELRDDKFPNRYARYLDRLEDAQRTSYRRAAQADAKKSLELGGILQKGCVTREYLRHDILPSAPLRAFTYTQAGGAASCGEHPNAIFKCPDGYAGSYNPQRRSGPLPRSGGYSDFVHHGNPFSNKIVLMDEVRQLQRASPPPP